MRGKLTQQEKAELVTLILLFAAFVVVLFLLYQTLEGEP